jgi:1-acyl-sn-glycerol-3-phosphate acyltransferase
VLATVVHRQGRRTRFLAVSGLWSVPVVGWLLRKGRMVPVHRGEGPQRMTADACVALDAGEAVLVYPEGTIADPRNELPARPGAGLLALRTRGPVIPVAVWGLGSDPHVRRGLRRRVGVAIGGPVDMSPWRGDRSQRAARDAAAAVLAAVRDLRPHAERAARGG